MWKVVVFLDDEVAAVPCSWLIKIQGKQMCFWPVKDARLKRARDENAPESGNDKYKLHECRVIMNDETFTNFKEALAMEIEGQETSYKDGNESDSSSSSKKQKLSDENEDDEFEFIKDEKETFTNFKEALAMEIEGQETSYKDGNESDSSSSSKKQKLSDENEDDEFEFIKDEKEIPIIDDDKVNKTSTASVVRESENELQSLQFSSSVLNNDEEVDPANDSLILLGDNQSNNLAMDTLEKNEVSEQIDVINRPLDVTKPSNGSNALHEVEALQLSDSEKINKILFNQEAEKKIYTELINRMDRVEKHIKKYGVGPSNKVIEELTLQVTSKDMFLKLEKDLLDAPKAALADHFNKTIFEKDIKQFVKILLNRFFDNNFYAHHVTGKTGGTVVLNKSQTLTCIYDCIEKKFYKKKRDVEDTVFKAIDQLKDALRKKFPKLPTDRKRKRDRMQKASQESESVEDKDKKNEAEAS